MPLCVLNERPVVSAVFSLIVLYYLVLCGVIGIFADFPRKLRVVGVYSRINYGNGYTSSSVRVPSLTDIKLVNVILIRVAGVVYRVRGQRGQIFLDFTRFVIKIERKIGYVFSVFP